MARDTLSTKQSDDFLTVAGNSFKLIKQSWGALQLNLLTFACLYAIPVVLISALIFWATLAGINSDGSGSVHIDSTAAIIMVVALIGIVILSIYVGIAAIITQLASVRGEKISFKEAIDQAQAFFWRFIGVALLSGLIILCGLVLFIIPGGILAVLLLFAPYYMIDRNIGAVEAIKTCYRVSKSNWKLPAAVLTVQVISQIPSFIPGIGNLIATLLGILYFCLPAIVYLRMPKPKAVKATPKKA